jgi:hypothetical protein
MQAVTLSGVGSLASVPFVNLPLGAALAVWQWKRALRVRWVSMLVRVAPWPAIAALVSLVLTLNLALPLEAADPYHLERVAQIERLGTLEYDPAVIPKVNVVGWVYELVLADVRAIPVAGDAILRLHGVWSLALYLLALAAVRSWLGETTGRWVWSVLLVVPVVFHQFVLVKNDLFIGMAAFVALAWVVVRSREAPPGETLMAAALIGFVIGCKLTSLPLAGLFAGAVLLSRAERWRSLGETVAGGALGAVAGGLFFTLFQNAKWYGDPFASGPVAEMGNMNAGIAAAAESVLRFAISLADLGLLTPRLWPDRGGWGSTFGLPFIWAALVLAAHAAADRHARSALTLAALHFLAFAVVFPDADVAQRLVLGSGVLVIVIAADLAARGGRGTRLARLALSAVVVLSAAQIARSAMLYFTR